VLNVPVAKIVLDRPGIVAVIGEFVPAGAAQHVRMHREPSLASSPALAMSFRTAESVSGPWRSVVNT